MRLKFSKKHQKEINLTAIFFGFLAVAFLIICWSAIHLINTTTSQIEMDLERESIKLERTLTDKIDHTFSVIKNINLQIENDPKNQKRIFEILRLYRNHPSLSDTFSWTIFSWSDENFHIIIDAEYGILDEPSDISIKDYIPITEKEPGKFHLGSPTVGSLSKKWVIPGGVGLVDLNGNYIGATTVGFEIETLAKLLQKVLENPDVKFKLYGKNEVAILYGDKKNYGASRGEDNMAYNQEVGKILDEINSSKSDSVFDISLIHNRHAFLARKVDNYPYILFLKYDDAAIFKSFWQTIMARIVEILSVTFGLILMLFLAYREQQQSRKILALKKAAEDANRAKTEFLNQTVHEFKNFVFGIQGCAEIIKSDLKDLIVKLNKKKFEDAKEEIEELETDLDLSCDIIESSHELNDFINVLNDLSHAEGGDYKIHKSKKNTNLSRILKQVIKLLQKRAKNAGIHLVSKINDEMFDVFDVDKRRIKQILTNLVSNAIKYSSKGSEVEITAKNITDPREIRRVNDILDSKKARRVEVIIKDYGFGMSENEVKIALQKHDSLEELNLKKIDSHGLSLPIINYLIEKQGGILEIISEKHKGTLIRIIF